MIFTRFRILSAISVFILSFMQIGGCDIKFGTSEDNGQGISNTEIVSGRVVNVIPDTGLEGIIVQITNKDNVISEGVTDSSGNFTVEGDFDNSPAVIKFLDSTDTSIGNLNVNIFPGVDMDLGNLQIDDGTVTLDQEAMVIFFGDIIENNCTGNNGSIDMEIKSVDVTVEINSSTDIERKSNNQNITCDDFIIGQELRVDGDLTFPTGTIVDGSNIEVQN